MARRPRSDAAWLRAALVEHRVKLVDRFDCPSSRAELAEHVARVESGQAVTVSRQELFMAVFAVNPEAAQPFAQTSDTTTTYVLTTDDALVSLPE